MWLNCCSSIFKVTPGLSDTEVGMSTGQEVKARGIQIEHSGVGLSILKSLKAPKDISGDNSH